MAITTEFHVKEKYLLVEAQGTDDNLQEVIEYQNTIAKNAYRHKIGRILCDERRLIYQISISEEFMLGNQLMKYASDLEKVAIICNEEFIKEARFFENVTYNIGLDILVTTDIQEAKAWIVSD